MASKVSFVELLVRRVHNVFAMPVPSVVLAEGLTEADEVVIHRTVTVSFTVFPNWSLTTNAEESISVAPSWPDCTLDILSG